MIHPGWAGNPQRAARIPGHTKSGSGVLRPPAQQGQDSGAVYETGTRTGTQGQGHSCRPLTPPGHREAAFQKLRLRPQGLEKGGEGKAQEATSACTPGPSQPAQQEAVGPLGQSVRRTQAPRVGTVQAPRSRLAGRTGLLSVQGGQERPRAGPVCPSAVTPAPVGCLVFGRCS